MEDEASTGLLSPVKVLLIDDDAFNREGVRLYLSQKGFHVLEASDTATARQIAIEDRPEVLVVDIVIPPRANTRFQMSQSAGIQLASHLKHAYPALAVVFFSAHENRGSEVWDMVREGMRGIAYVLKGRQPGVLLDAIQATLSGQVVIDPEVLMNPRSLADDLLEQLTAEERSWIELAVERLDQLSPREREAANRLAASHNTEGIATSLGITPKTVENYISNIYEKLGLNEMTSRAPNLRKVLILAKACMIKELQTTGGQR